MFTRLRELDPAPPGGPREPVSRIVGCCRDFTLLFVSLARHHGIPAEPARADELAELLADPDLEQLRVVFEADDVRVPPMIRSVIPPGPVPVEVVLR
ncbi:hypothetical protein [Amycolatopsis sp. cmx-8-4]|uniref:hypothetical protein n=1 Tax=Amycolatopsis sp. cmx-8-4 TaxID=2790947 RepID=UPI0039787AAB